MVDYDEFVSIVFAVVREANRDKDATEVMQAAGKLWSRNKQQLEQLTEADTIRWVQRHLEIR